MATVDSVDGGRVLDTVEMANKLLVYEKHLNKISEDARALKKQQDVQLKAYVGSSTSSSVVAAQDPECPVSAFVDRSSTFAKCPDVVPGMHWSPNASDLATHAFEAMMDDTQLPGAMSQAITDESLVFMNATVPRIDKKLVHKRRAQQFTRCWSANMCVCREPGKSVLRMRCKFLRGVRVAIPSRGPDASLLSAGHICLRLQSVQPVPEEQVPDVPNVDADATPAACAEEVCVNQAQIDK